MMMSLTGCQTLSTVTSTDTVCTAIGKPITYTSKNDKSDYYAARKLAPQIAVKNRTGINLGCPAYKK